MYHCLVIEYVDGVDSLRYVVLERSCIVEDVGTCVIVPIKEDVTSSEEVVIVVAGIEEI